MNRPTLNRPSHSHLRVTRLGLLACALLLAIGCKREKTIEDYGGPINFPEPQPAQEGSGGSGGSELPHRVATLLPEDGSSEPGYLTVNAETPGDVYIDGRPIDAETPVEEYPVAPGRHTIQIASAGQTAFSRVFNSLNNAGLRTAVYLRDPEEELADPLGELPDPPAVIRVASGQPGVIIVNGRRTQLVPPQVMQLPPGEYSFQVLYEDGTLSRQYQIPLLPGQPRHLELAGVDQLLFRSGSIREEGRGLTEEDFSEPDEALPDFSGFVAPTPTLQLSVEQQAEGSGAAAQTSDTPEGSVQGPVGQADDEPEGSAEGAVSP